MRYLITDSADFLRDALQRAVSATDSKPMPPVFDRVHIDLLDPNQAAEQMRGFDIVVHATTPFAPRERAEDLKWRLVAGTENLLNAALVAGVRRTVLISTSDVTLHRGNRINWDEARDPPQETTLGLRSRYARLAEEIAIAFRSRGHSTVSLRPAWIWGPGMPDPRSPAERSKQIGLRLIGNGDKYIATTFIDSLADAVLRASSAANPDCGRYYVADDEMLNAKQFFVGLSDALGIPQPQIGLPAPLMYAKAKLEEARGGPGLWRSDVIRRGYPAVFDTLNARRELGWTPTHSHEAGLAQTRRARVDPL